LERQASRPLCGPAGSDFEEPARGGAQGRAGRMRQALGAGPALL
jgi:hypothetical protein